MKEERTGGSLTIPGIAGITCAGVSSWSSVGARAVIHIYRYSCIIKKEKNG